MRVAIVCPGGVDAWTLEGKSVPLIEEGEVFLTPSSFTEHLQDELSVLSEMQRQSAKGESNGGEGFNHIPTANRVWRDMAFRERRARRNRRKGFWSRLVVARSSRRRVVASVRMDS